MKGRFAHTGHKGGWGDAEDRRQRRLVDLLRSAIPAANTPAERYLTGLGAAAAHVPLHFKYHERITHPVDRSRLYPALLCPLQDRQGVCGVQRIYLTEQKPPASEAADAAEARWELALVEPPRAALGTVQGAAVLFGHMKPDQVLACSVEQGMAAVTALARAGLFDVSVAAVLGRANLQHFHLSPKTQRLVVLDGTGAGLAKADEAEAAGIAATAIATSDWTVARDAMVAALQVAPAVPAAEAELLERDPFAL